MAYDQSSSYQAPRRAYYDHHQQAPVQRQNGGYPPQQQFDGYDHPHDQGYGQPHQQNGGHDDYGYDMNQQSGQYYGDHGASNAYGHEQYDQGYPQQDYGRQDHRQGGYPQQSNGHGRPNDGYANGHQEAYNSQDRHYDPRGQQQPNRGGRPQQSNGYGHPREGYAAQNYEDAGSHDRQYDPRYQQRPGRGGHPPSNGSRSQRPPPTANQDYRGEPPQPRSQQLPASRDDPRNGHPQHRPDQQAQAPDRNRQDQRNGYGERRDVPDIRDRPDRRPLPPQSNGGSRQPQPPPQEPKKSAMEEWKAKERARLHEEANKPKMIPQDNAFPTFGNNKNEGRSEGGQESRSTRSSREHARPSTSNGRNESRPGSSKSNNYQQPDAQGRPQNESQSARAPQQFARIHEQPRQEHSAQYAQQRGDHGREQPPQSQWQNNGQSRRPVPSRSNTAPQSYEPPHVPSNNTMPPQTYSAEAYDRRAPGGYQRDIPPPQAQQQQPPPQPPNVPNIESARPNVSAPQPEEQSIAQSEDYYPQESWRTGPPKKRPVLNRAPQSEAVPSQEPWRTGPPNTRPHDQATARQPEVIPTPVVPLTVALPQVAPPVAYQAPPRVLSPLSQQPRSGAQPTHAPPKNFARPQVVPVNLAREESLDDVYDDYYGQEQYQPASVAAPPKNREEEIESEMPDFDSAAPGQTSGVHKRQQTVDRHLKNAPAEAPPQMPMMPSQHFNASVQSLPVHGHQPYEHYQDPAIATQPELRDMRPDQGGAADGFVFGVPGEQVRPQQQYSEPRQMQPNQQSLAYRPVQSVPPENMRRFQSPADQRPMNIPMHGGPPGEHPQGQQFHPGGRGPLPPQQRSASTRPPMAQVGWSDPGLQRAPTAPPMRQDSYGAPHHGPPRTGSLTNQQHRGPGAPPGQQPMRGMPPPGGPRNGPPFGQQQGMRPPPQGQRLSDPDSLPHHPAPYRPGLSEQGAPRPSNAEPARNYDNRSSTSSHQRNVSISDKPVTKESLEQARLDTEANRASPRLNLRYAKKLVEASHVLASEGGRLDAKSTQRNREKYLNEAYKRVKELVRNTYPEAQFFMAECYGSGEMGLQIDPKEAFGLYQAAAKGGHAAAAFRTAVSCEIGPEEGGGTRKDYPKAVQWYRRAAALGDIAAMYKLGIVLLRGLLGVPRNVGEAVSWLKRATERADKDNPHALHELGTLHEATAGADPQVREKIIPDEPYALSLFKQAAELGFKRSQFRLGQAYEYGSLGLDIDNRASIAWYTKAAAQGEHNAELALSGWYLTGAEGMLDQSDMEAYLWARKAAQSEPPLAKAMFAMGYFTEQGIGCPKSLEEAKRWYGRAASFQFPRALERLEELRKGGKNKSIQNGKLTRDKKKDDENCVVM